ncbi:glycerophosphodiester phosphodiesterase family protein [Candidatus Latescibacterota bacterium]
MTNQHGPDSTYPDETMAMDTQFIQLYGRLGGLTVYRNAVDRLHDHGVIVNHCWASDPESIRFLAEAGVDYILTNDLDLCLEVLAADEPGDGEMEGPNKRKV